MQELLSLLTPAWWVTLLSIGLYAFAFWAIGDVLRQRREPMAMLAWILGILLIPMLGPFLYFLVGERRVRRRGRRKRKKAAVIVRAIAHATGIEERGVPATRPGAQLALDESLRQLAEISTKLGSSPLIAGNKVDAFTSAQDVYEDILRSIDAARQHIHLEYYIFHPDDTGRMFLDRLVKKAREGIEVRLLLDGIGSWNTWPSFLRPLREAGGRVETFLPAIPWRRPWHINCRNHRKIVVVDGKVAYTGSQNIGDEYRGRLRKVGPWKDTHLRIEGPAVRELEEVFVEDWFFASKENLTALKYLRRQPAAGDSLVQIFPTGPDQENVILSHIYFAALALARSSIRISTPYFVPDPGLILALQHAAYRGIQVDILIPSKTDNLIVLWAGRSYYQELVRAGVNIHEFEHGMLHSKVVSVDDQWTLISSANMDQRSFLFNFEVTASVFDERISRKLHEEFESDLRRSSKIKPAAGTGPVAAALLEGAARLLSPLL